jgi:hypothetical protein
MVSRFAAPMYVGQNRRSELGSSPANDGQDRKVKVHRRGLFDYLHCMSSTKMLVLLVLCLQNSMFTVLRRYSQGVLREVYSKVRFYVSLVESRCIFVRLISNESILAILHIEHTA